MGVDFFPALVALSQWGERWLEPAGVELRHRECGGCVRVELSCEHGHDISVGDIELVARTHPPD
jgi:hypothetical protein